MSIEMQQLATRLKKQKNVSLRLVQTLNAVYDVARKKSQPASEKIEEIIEMLQGVVEKR